MTRTPYQTHVTRMSDSSFYDEVCVLCGATDAGPQLDNFCPVGVDIHETHAMTSLHQTLSTAECKGCREIVSSNTPVPKELQMACIPMTGNPFKTAKTTTPVKPRDPVPTFDRELIALIEKHQIGNGSATSAPVLAAYLLNCLTAFEKATTSRAIHKLL